MKPSAAAVLELVARDGGACLWDFQDRRIGRFGGRIFELRKLGYVISARQCDRHEHTNFIETYELVAMPSLDGQIALVVAE